MPVNEVFLDTWALLAIVNRADAFHQTALELNKKLSVGRTLLVTSDWVLTEFLSSASRPPVRTGATEFVSALRSSTRITVIEATRNDWERVFAFFASHSDKAWSFVDCSSMLLCRDRNIRGVFTAHRHFEQFGLEILVKHG